MQPSQGKLDEAARAENLRAICSPTLLAVIAIMSSVGLVTGFFLKYLDSVLKSIASALEVIVTTLLSSLLFGTALNVQTVIAACLVGSGVTLYSKPPRHMHFGREMEHANAEAEPILNQSRTKFVDA